MVNNRKRHPKRRSLSFEGRLRVFCTLAALCLLGLVAALLALLHVSASPTFATLGILILVLLLVFSGFIEEAIRPIQTLANVVAALREEDYSFRARGANREDSVGQLALEINALADTLQTQRVASLDAVALLRRVIAEMDAPVLAFDQEGRLRLVNPAAERVFSLLPARDLGKSAAQLSLTSLLEHPSDTVLSLDSGDLVSLRPDDSTQATRWMIRRSTFRQRGVPHTLVVLSDVSAALREEERLAWRRLIRVIGHEISNSLTPIKSIAGSLRSRLQPPVPVGAAEAANGISASPAVPALPAMQGAPQAAGLQRDLNRGLSVIENRAESLNRFVQAYRQLAQLPAPVLRRVALLPLLERAVSLEIRLEVRIVSAPAVDLLADPDQMEQLLINLVRNAVEAAMPCADDALPPVLDEVAPGSDPAENRETGDARCTPAVTIRATEEGDLACIQITDNGPGLANPDNLFVPLYTTKKSGSGVGLALARQIVEAHGGAIALRNRGDTQGCIAEVRIPLADPIRS